MLCVLTISMLLETYPEAHLANETVIARDSRTNVLSQAYCSVGSKVWFYA